MTPPVKIPRSVLVVIATHDQHALMIERADYAGFWQSVTGSQEVDETFAQTAAREVTEETGFATSDGTLLDLQYESVYCIYPRWRHRYPPGTTHNRERCFALLLPAVRPPTLAPREHVAWRWLPLAEAARCASSWSNAAAIETLSLRWPLIAAKRSRPV
ncbi:MAG: dihydroneopterin triphosphate diphosphatase [Burkholderiales bacterium]|nr:dihydroneopterin triphosphate diphosphatase [Burkholderiales bacterium]